MNTFRVHFQLDLNRPNVDIECTDITMIGSAFVATRIQPGMTEPVCLAVWMDDTVSFIERLAPGPQAPNFYKLTYRAADVTDQIFPASGIQLTEDSDWVRGWDNVALIGWLRKSNLDNAVLIHSLVGIAPPVITEAPPPEAPGGETATEPPPEESS